MTDLTKGPSGQGHDEHEAGTVGHQPHAGPPAQPWAPPPGDGAAPPIPGQPAAGPYGQPPGPYGQPPAPYGQPPLPYGYPPQGGMSIGKQRSTGTCILLFFVTFGIYGLVWYFMVHDEMKRHSGQGLGGGLALVLAFLVGFVSPFFASSEVGMLYERRGQAKPVSGVTGAWYIPGILIIVGPFIWFIKTNGALNDYWRSVGAQ